MSHQVVINGSTGHRNWENHIELYRRNDADFPGEAISAKLQRTVFVCPESKGNHPTLSTTGWVDWFKGTSTTQLPDLIRTKQGLRKKDFPCNQSNDWNDKKNTFESSHSLLQRINHKKKYGDSNSTQSSPWSDWTSAPFSSHQSSDPRPARATWYDRFHETSGWNLHGETGNKRWSWNEDFLNFRL